MMSTLFFIFIGALLVNNFVLVRFLGICPFLGVSRQLETAVGMGMAVTFVMTLSGIVTWVLQHYVLSPFGLAFLQTLLFILVIASLVQFVGAVPKKDGASSLPGAWNFPATDHNQLCYTGPGVACGSAGV